MLPLNYYKRYFKYDFSPIFLAIHCKWDNWAIGTCITQTELEDGTHCGPGTRTNTRVKLVEESNGGTCDGKYEETLECMDKECPGRKLSKI